jgi:hypothetical protein
VSGPTAKVGSQSPLRGGGAPSTSTAPREKKRRLLHSDGPPLSDLLNCRGGPTTVGSTRHRRRCCLWVWLRQPRQLSRPLKLWRLKKP